MNLLLAGGGSTVKHRSRGAIQATATDAAFCCFLRNRRTCVVGTHDAIDMRIILFELLALFRGIGVKSLTHETFAVCLGAKNAHKKL
jgi:hypothetical protein